MTRPAKRAVGLEAIIVYKLVKACASGILGIAALVLLYRGAEAAAATLAETLLEWSTRAWVLKAATLLVIGATSAHVKWAAIVAFGDAVLSAVEGLALRGGKWWAPWLVVVATGAFLPWELIELAVHPGWIRLGVLLVNLAVLAYLLRAVVREHRTLELEAHRAAARTGGR